MGKSSSQLQDAAQEENRDDEDGNVRVILGATVYFGKLGDVVKVSFPTDYSIASITGFTSDTSREAIISMLKHMGFETVPECIRIRKSALTSELTAMVKIQDPMFAQNIQTQLKHQNSHLSASMIPVNASQASSKKMHLSWHVSTKRVWLNFDSKSKANRFAEKFNSSMYNFFGRNLASTTATDSGDGNHYYRRSIWTVVLSNVPGHATEEDIDNSIRSQHDKPDHIEMGPASYTASSAEVSVVVRQLLEELGPLENFYLSSTTTGKRVKATAHFIDEADARSACYLDNTSFDSLDGNKLSSTKIKVSTAVYNASTVEINTASQSWREKWLIFLVYPDKIQTFTTLKIQGSNIEDVASARRELDRILSGVVLTDGDIPLWHTALNSNGATYAKLKMIEKELEIVIERIRSTRQLRYHGPLQEMKDARSRITAVFRDISTARFTIPLEPRQFQLIVHSGLQTLQQALGKEVVELDVITQKIIISGANQQYQKAMEILWGHSPVHQNGNPGSAQMCTICYDDEPDHAVQTACKHIYCLECFENCCTAAASSERQKFSVECQGDMGKCSAVLTLTELKDHLPSSTFEMVLNSSFAEYVKRRPNEFHYCPTPDCNFVYRCTPASDVKTPPYTCPSCIESICTSCHARHGDYTCAEYREITSGGSEALEKLKKDLNIKDCPICETSMEKIEGCNHMTCPGCNSHICWVCLAVFASWRPCYAHMSEEHGGYGVLDFGV